MYSSKKFSKNINSSEDGEKTSCATFLKNYNVRVTLYTAQYENKATTI